MEDALNRILQSIESLKSDLRNSLSYEPTTKYFSQTERT